MFVLPIPSNGRACLAAGGSKNSDKINTGSLPAAQGVAVLFFLCVCNFIPATFYFAFRGNGGLSVVKMAFFAAVVN